MNREEAHLDQCTQEHILQAISYLDSDEWLQLFHQPDPSGINNLRIAVSTVLSAIMGMYSAPQPDPITGLVPCGCGGKAAVKKGVNHRSGYYVICEKCECNIGLDRDDYLRPYGAYPTEEQAVSDWNTAMGCTAPPRPGAIGPDAGEMAPNGDEGEES